MVGEFNCGVAGREMRLLKKNENVRFDDVNGPHGSAQKEGKLPPGCNKRS